MSPADTLLRHHERTRSRGVFRPLFTFLYWTLRPLILAYFRVARIGRHHIPRRGPVLLAANHRSFLDPFAIASCARRPIYFVAKRELFEKRLQGWLLNALGAFPVRRGESDEESMATARLLLERGEAVLIFPEGTRVRTGSLATPRRGAGRLALETGAPVVPVAITGSERARRGWRVRPVRVRVRCGRPLTFPRVERPSQHLATEVTSRIWTCVELQWEWLGGLPPLRKAAVVGAGAMGTALAVLLARGGLEVELGCRTEGRARRIADSRRNGGYLPGVELPAGVRPAAIDAIELAGVDLVAFCVPASDLPAAVGELGARIGSRSAVLVTQKGLVGRLGTRASRYVADRVAARAVAAMSGPMHAVEAVRGGASVALATADPDFGAQLRDALAGGGLDVDLTDDMVGTELAGCAKNAASLAAAAAVAGTDGGMNAAGAVAGRVFAEVHALAVASGGRSETFAGVAGAGDLVATVLAERSRNRRAGELLGRGVPAEQVADRLRGPAESLHSVPLLADAFERSGVAAPVTCALRALIEGAVTADEWIDDVRAVERTAARHAA